MSNLTILQGDALTKLRELPDESVHCCVTSPPYWGLGDYGTAQWEGGDAECDHRIAPSNLEKIAPKIEARDGFESAFRCGTAYINQPQFKAECPCGAKRIDSQLGLEKTPGEYVAKMVEVFREVRRVLRNDGTLWCNMGDCYASQGDRKHGGWNGDSYYAKDGQINPQRIHGQAMGAEMDLGRSGLKPKDLCGIPWRLAFALQADGWWLRSDIIWHKPNPMPESCTDRPTKSHEYLFLLTKSARYFYDAEAIKEGAVTDERPRSSWSERSKYEPMRRGDPAGSGHVTMTATLASANGRNKRSVWTVATAPYPESHFATFPPNLIKPCILAGTSAKGCCAKCGAPWERVMGGGHNAYPGSSTDHTQDGIMSCGAQKHSSGRSAGTIMARRYYESIPPKTTGWQRTCACNLSGGVDGNENAPAEIPENTISLKSPRVSMAASGSSAPPARTGCNSDGLQSPNATPEGCTVLDPFAGSGTSGQVALELGRKAILIELNPKYVELIKRRCDVTPGLALA